MMRWLVTRGLIPVLTLLVLAPRATAATLGDTDGDRYLDTHDNCLAIPNPTQLDTDRDGFGNHCDPDYDNDGSMGLPDYVAISGAVGTASANLDLTGDGYVSVADLVAVSGRLGSPPGPSGFDPDRDGFAFLDNCLAIPNPTQLDTDRDGFGNHCDPDYDNDGSMGLADHVAISGAVGTASANLDLTGDGYVGAADLVAVAGHLGLPPGPSGFDPDGDGFAFLDNCIEVPNPTQLDTDRDGFGNHCDPDYDNDGSVGLRDYTAVSRAAGTTDPDFDLTGDGSVTMVDVQRAESRVGLRPGPSGFDTDADGFAFHDDCPDLANPSQEDRDGDGLGDACDPYSAAQECVGSDWQPGALPVVTATCDRDGVEACTAEDLNLALLECSGLGGCILQLLARTYTDVAIDLYDGTKGPAPHGCQPEMSHCLTAPFPNGLVIQGHGSRSVLRSPVFSGGELPYPVLGLYRRPELRLRMRNLTLDGNKERQDSLTLPRSAWRHAGFETSNYFASLRRSESGCIHNVVAQNFLSAGLSFGDVENWVFEYNTVQDIGCHDTLTPCPGIADTVPVAPLSNGERVAGNGIGPGSGSAGLIYRGNTLTRITKYSLHFKGSNDGSSYLIDGGVMEDNRITDSGSRGIYVAGLKNGWISNNQVEQGNQFRADGDLHNDELSAFLLAGRIEDSVFADNEIRNNAGPALSYRAAGAGVVFSNTTITGGCKQRNPSTCNSPGAPNPGMCYGRGELSIDQSAGQVRFEDTAITDSLCRFVLSSQPGVATADIDLVGGTLESGPLASPDVGRTEYGAINVGGRGVLTLDGGVVLRNKGKPDVDGVVLTYGGSTAVVKDAVVEGFLDDYHRDDYLGGGTFVFCDRDPANPRCR